jgi:hypothetical protein
MPAVPSPPSPTPPLHFAAFVMNTAGHIIYEDFVDHVVPVLQHRGLMQREYAGGTLRHKLFGRGDRLPERHPAARYRGAFAPQPA